MQVEAGPMTKIFDLVPSWLYVVAVTLLLVGLLGQRVQVSNAKANVARSAQALSDYKLSVSETTRILQADNDRKALAQLTRQKEAADAAKTREAVLRGDADGARTELDRLRHALRVATRRDPVSGTTAPAADQPAATKTVVFLDCAAALTDMARAADGHASDTKTLIDSWPR
jgi:hypothetical protein